jgi:threonine dehydrogenase-like Zn-dependent dehydrogenase
MKTIVWHGPRQMSIEEAPLPTPLPHEVVVQVGAVGICGSELSGYLGHNSLRVPPLVMGHEFAGRVAVLGSAVENLCVGDRVAVNPLITCGVCPMCLRGLDSLCLHRQIIGAHRPGAFADYVAVPAANCILLPDNMSAVAGSLAEPLACGVRAARIAGVTAGDRVLVIGAGAIGLMCITGARRLGGDVVLVSDVSDGRLETARTWGARCGANALRDDVPQLARDLSDDLGVDVAIDAVGNTAARRAAVRAVRPGGTVVLVGLHEAETSLEANYIVRSETRVLGSFAYSKPDFAQAVRMLAGGEVTPHDSWLEERGLDACADSFAQLVDAPPPVAKIVLKP